MTAPLSYAEWLKLTPAQLLERTARRNSWKRLTALRQSRINRRIDALLAACVNGGQATKEAIQRTACKQGWEPRPPA
jgi:hypothetical protein